MPASLATDGPQIAQNIVDSVTESQGKIVVTTTISLDRDSLEARLPLSSKSEPPSGQDFNTGSAANDNLNLQQMQQAAKDGRITLLELAPKTYIGFVNGRVKAHPLCIGDTLFIFVSRHNSLTGMAELVAELMRQLPPGASWNGQDRAAQIEHIAQLLGASGEVQDALRR